MLSDIREDGRQEVLRKVAELLTNAESSQKAYENTLVWVVSELLK